MNDSWRILRDNDKQLALCLLFAPRADRQLLADIFCLANELENAVNIPSEIILAAIRLQWWYDAIENVAARHTFGHPAVLAAPAFCAATMVTQPVRFKTFIPRFLCYRRI